MEEDHAEVGALVVGLDDEAAVHVGMATRLVDEELPHMVEVRRRPPALLEDRGALEWRHSTRHDPERLAGRVVVGRGDDEPVSWR